MFLLHKMWEALQRIKSTAGLEFVGVPIDMIAQHINVPTAPNSIIVMKLRKNCFFFTWNLVIRKRWRKKKSNIISRLEEDNCRNPPIISTVSSLNKVKYRTDFQIINKMGNVLLLTRKAWYKTNQSKVQDQTKCINLG
jgi:hypothetical protein